MVPITYDLTEKIFIGVVNELEYHDIIEGALYQDLSIESFAEPLILNKLIIDNPYIRVLSNYILAVEEIGYELEETSY